MSYKYNVGYTFTIEKDNTKYEGKIIKIASMDEFGCDFYYSEKNYVVEFKNINKPIATYNIFRNGEYKYIMNERDIF
jgi:hypothetical protein